MEPNFIPLSILKAGKKLKLRQPPQTICVVILVLRENSTLRVLSCWSLSPCIFEHLPGAGEVAHPQPHFCGPTWNAAKRGGTQHLTHTGLRGKSHECLLNWIKEF